VNARLAVLAVIEQLTRYFPTPWRIEHDWTVEVRAGRSVVVKTTGVEDAQAIIEVASGLGMVSRSWTRLIEILLKHLAIEHPIPWRVVPSGRRWEVLAADDITMAEVSDRELADKMVEFVVQHEANMLVFAAERELEDVLRVAEEGPFEGFGDWWDEKRRQEPEA
jgi:hypothetical protein